MGPLSILLAGNGVQPAILLAFSSIGLTMALSDWRDWARGPVTGKARIARHLGRMLGGTIATITAAGAVNLSFLPDLVVWLGPAAIITPVIFWWTVHVTRGTAHKAAPAIILDDNGSPLAMAKTLGIAPKNRLTERKSFRPRQSDQSTF